MFGVEFSKDRLGLPQQLSGFLEFSLPSTQQRDASRSDRGSNLLPELAWSFERSGDYDKAEEVLKEAVTLMASGGIDNKNKSALVADRGLTDAEIDAITALLGALDCEKTLSASE